MTYQAFNDGPFVRGYGDETEEYYQRRWALRCNGEQVLEDYYEYMPCHIHSDGEYERTPVAELRELATREGWRTYTYNRKIVDLCPSCDKRLEYVLRLAKAYPA